MPELPEVYSIVKGLNKIVKNIKIIDAQVHNSKIVNGKSNKREFSDKVARDFISKTKGKTIKDIKRKGKLIIIDFVEKGGLIVHLKMTGQLIFFDKKPVTTKHSHVILKLDGEQYLIYNDIRKFGYVNYFDDQSHLDSYINSFKLDPIDDEFTMDYFKSIKKFKTEIKKVFLDQKIILGIGNIYSDEICFDAGILPSKKCNELSEKQVKNLFNSIDKILKNSISLGGSSISDYVLADGTKGSYQNHHKVYGRGGKPCLVCGNNLQKIKISGRATVYCNICQS